MIAKTEAIVLRSMKFRDTSKIVTFYTREFGKLKAVAKGARDNKSKFGASLEPMTHVGLVVYKKETRDLQLVSQCDIIEAAKRTHSEIERMAAGLAIVELVDKVAHDEEENIPLFSLMTESLNSIERESRNYQSIFFSFEIRLAALFGFAPALQSCSRCGKLLKTFDPGELGTFRLMKGSVLCPACCRLEKRSLRAEKERGTHKTTIKTLNILQMFLTEPMHSVTSIEFDEFTGNEIDETLRLYLRHHIQDLQPLKSTDLFQKILTE